MKNNQTNQPDDNYIDSEKDLILVNKELESHEDFYKMALQFQQIMMVYESAIKQVETKLEILNKEYKVFGRRNPIETIKSRIKTPESIATKLQKKGVPVTFKSMSENLTDIAGVRVICPYISDIYTIKDVLLKHPGAWRRLLLHERQEAVCRGRRGVLLRLGVLPSRLEVHGRNRTEERQVQARVPLQTSVSLSCTTCG